MSNVKIIGNCYIDENVKFGQNITIHNNVNLLEQEIAEILK